MFNTFTLKKKIHFGSQLNWRSVLRMHSMKTKRYSRNFYGFFSFISLWEKEASLWAIKGFNIFNFLALRTDYKVPQLNISKDTEKHCVITPKMMKKQWVYIGAISQQ